MIFSKTKSGFTMVEIILVVTIMLSLFGLAASYYNNSQIRADINIQSSNIAYYLRLASSSASSGLNNENHGVHFDPTGYTIFEGDVYIENNASNFEIELPETMIIEPINLNGGGSDVIFYKSNGETENYGTISVTAPNINKTVTIQINQSGAINY